MAAPISQLSPHDLATRLKNSAGPAPLLLDVRTPLEHQEVHLPGTRLIPLDQLDPAAVCTAFGQDQEVVVICRSGARAAKAAQKLAEGGMKKIAVLEGGTLAWTAAGLPVNRGRKGVSLERQVRISAGTLVLLGTVLGTWVHPGFYGLSAFVGAGLVFAGITDWCGMGLLLARAPWNQVPSEPAVCSR
ncbi:rhodanese-like domain-containing protein [Verrucomicrobium spinosum]|uniref:rhodanese-like domain-containing protein n=1 Tax=Verrucomicrobium spinosum TaxID=2736 RepID=UPI0006A708EF|nr:rhodanese-like domain-containing protein [Verrucomicrobium spinosum]